MGIIYIKKNTEALRTRLLNEGVKVCNCAYYDGWDWVFCGANKGFVHGIPPFETDTSKLIENGDRQCFIDDLTDEDICCETVDDFISMIKKKKK